MWLRSNYIFWVLQLFSGLFVMFWTQNTSKHSITSPTLQQFSVFGWIQLYVWIVVIGASSTYFTGAVDLACSCYWCAATCFQNLVLVLTVLVPGRVSESAHLWFCCWLPQIMSHVNFKDKSKISFLGEWSNFLLPSLLLCKKCHSSEMDLNYQITFTDHSRLT